jgi:hypothetical protein
MNSRERVKRVINREKTDCIAVAPYMGNHCAIVTKTNKNMADIVSLKVPNPYKDGRMPVYIESVDRVLSQWQAT